MGKKGKIIKRNIIVHNYQISKVKTKTKKTIIRPITKNTTLKYYTKITTANFHCRTSGTKRDSQFWDSELEPSAGLKVMD